MTNTLCLDQKYSTTRLLTQEKQEIINSSEDKFETILFLPEGEWRKGEGGLRTKGYFKNSFEDKPLIGIITVVFNGEKYLEETIQSVINQTYANVEYIIIDGGSTDRTLDIIKKYEDKIDYWVSERDSGIYDAMNKGIDVASGEWINFMNAGDGFYDNDVLEKLFANKLYADVDFIYGDLEIDYGEFKRIQMARSLSAIWKGMAFSHQSCFIKSAFHKENKYSLDYKIASDFNLFYNAHQKNNNFAYANVIISRVVIGGLSDTSHLKVNAEKYEIVKQSHFKIKYMIYYKFMHFYIMLKNTVKFLIGKNLTCIIKKLK